MLNYGHDIPASRGIYKRRNTNKTKLWSRILVPCWRQWMCGGWSRKSHNNALWKVKFSRCLKIKRVCAVFLLFRKGVSRTPNQWTFRNVIFPGLGPTVVLATHIFSLVFGLEELFMLCMSEPHRNCIEEQQITCDGSKISQTAENGAPT